MNEKEICFIMCVNNDFLANECQLYINQLIIPEGYSIDIISVKDAPSMTSGYNAAMNSSNAKYKIYLHQDVLIVNKNIVNDLLSVFHSNSSIGMIGIVGNRKLGIDGCPWSEGSVRIGRLLHDLILENSYSSFNEIKGLYEEVIAIDGLFIATSQDIQWREDLFTGWDMYDLSQSIEFRKAGYKVVVPNTDHPWCLHDNDIIDLTNYQKWLNVFKNEYHKELKDWIHCD